MTDMSDQPPTIYHLYGDDHLAMEEFVQSLQEKLGPGSTAAMNVQVFSAPGFNFAEFEESCLSIPFLTPRRIIVLDGVENLPKDKKWLERFQSLLSTLPASTALVLIESRDPGRSNRKPSAHPISKWIAEHPEISYRRECTVPRGIHFVQWIQSRCSELGGEILSDAAQLLANWVIEDPFQADQELRKLVAYVDGSRPINSDDVQKLTPFQSQSNIFALVDAIGERQGSQAQRLLARILQEEEPGYAFAMIVRQFRLLLITREAIDLGTPTSDVLSLPAFVVRKIEAQARAFNDHELKAIYSKLLDMDVDSKTRSIDLEVGMDTLIASIAVDV
jgi:DNA polymerase-3 subunit delta